MEKAQFVVHPICLGLSWSGVHFPATRLSNKAFFEGAPPVNKKKKDQYKLKADIEDHTGDVSIEWKL